MKIKQKYYFLFGQEAVDVLQGSGFKELLSFADDEANFTLTTFEPKTQSPIELLEEFENSGGDNFLEITKSQYDRLLPFLIPQP